MRSTAGLTAWLCVGFALWTGSAGALEREKLLTDPGVYGTFAVFKMDEDWAKLDGKSKQSAVKAAKDIFQRHADKIVVDTYLVRGLSDRADFFLRIHSTEMINTQNFLVDFMASPLGRHATNTQTLNGLTKTLNYVPAFPDEMKAGLKKPVEPGPKPYAIVIPIRKDAAWWRLDDASRSRQMQEHTTASLPYLETVKRKLYHSSGLDDFDFITYFETAKLDDFNNLVIGLEQIEENAHNARFGHPTLLGTIRPLDELLDILKR